MDVVAVVRSRGGIVLGAELIAMGVARRRLTALVQSGTLRRPRKGVYSTLAPHHPRFRAARVGGRLTGASALAELGAWMLRPPDLLEIAVERGSSRLREDPLTALSWTCTQMAPESEAVVSLHDALVRVALRHDLEVSVPCFDWAFRTGRLDRFAFERVLVDLPAHARVIAHWVDPRSQSLLESVARVRLMRRGWSVRSQVRVGDLEAIDLVVNDVVGLELDGREYHESTFERDRRKDAMIAIEGRHGIRASYGMVVHEWSLVQRAIAAALLARGAHYSVTPPPEPRGTRRRPKYPRAID
jgi:very-short-patch-repair endonuclease